MLSKEQLTLPVMMLLGQCLTQMKCHPELETQSAPVIRQCLFQTSPVTSLSQPSTSPLTRPPQLPPPPPITTPPCPQRTVRTRLDLQFPEKQAIAHSRLPYNFYSWCPC